ncbi:metal ABC transporter substrate-binding protein [Variovorax sp. Root434]|nr:metal ABC transporter substrate-binding protein [Variovorax sp. Root434]
MTLMTTSRRLRSFQRTTGLAIAAALFAAAPFLTAQAQQQHAHVHGQLKLDVAVDGPTVVIDMESPLDNIVGFERAPRTDAEKKLVEEAVAQLRAADKLFIVDPAANCKLGPVDLRSGALGLGNPDPAEPVGHADLDATFSFNCTNATAAKFIDLNLFGAFKGLRQIDSQIATAQGQFKRQLKRPAGAQATQPVRLSWGK